MGPAGILSKIAKISIEDEGNSNLLLKTNHPQPPNKENANRANLIETPMDVAMSRPGNAIQLAPGGLILQVILSLDKSCQSG